MRHGADGGTHPRGTLDCPGVDALGPRHQSTIAYATTAPPYGESIGRRWIYDGREPAYCDAVPSEEWARDFGDIDVLAGRGKGKGKGKGKYKAIRAVGKDGQAHWMKAVMLQRVYQGFC